MALTNAALGSRAPVVTALAAVNGLGRSTTVVFQGIAEGRRGLSDCPLNLPLTAPCGVVPGELPSLPARHRDQDSRQARLAFLGYSEIAEAVAVAVDRYGPSRVGLVLGTSTGGIAAGEEAYFHWLKTGLAPRGFDFASQYACHAAAWLIRTEAGLGGPSFIVSTACSSSAKAFSSARRLLLHTDCSAVLVGGVDSLAQTTVQGFHSLGVASATPCCPFSATRDGMNVGEGAAFILLEREGEGLAHLVGVGETDDAFHMSAPDPEGRGAAGAMRAALDNAGIDAADVGYVNAHGTGTQRNDAAEATAIEAVFGREVPVVSTKSYTGHLLGAAGATEAVFAIRALGDQRVPANLGLATVDPEIALNLPVAPSDASLAFAASISLGFGGSNIALIFAHAEAGR